MVKTWFYVTHGGRIGPVTVDDLVDALLTPPLSEETLVWREGLASWVPALQLPELVAFFPPPASQTVVRVGETGRQDRSIPRRAKSEGRHTLEGSTSGRSSPGGGSRLLPDWPWLVGVAGIILGLVLGLRSCSEVSIKGVADETAQGEPPPIAQPSPSGTLGPLNDEDLVVQRSLSGSRAPIVQAEATRILNEWDAAHHDYRQWAAARVYSHGGLRGPVTEGLADAWCGRISILDTGRPDPRCVGGELVLGPGAIQRAEAWERLLLDAARVDAARMRMIAASTERFDVSPVWCSIHMIESDFKEKVWTRDPDLTLWLVFTHEVADRTGSRTDNHTFKR